jgi:hypothetical protein
MLHGLTPLKRLVDEGASFVELMRNDWKELLDQGSIAQENRSITYPTLFVRGIDTREVREWSREFFAFRYFLRVQSILLGTSPKQLFHGIETRTNKRTGL